jgi:hypothetical protein
MAIKKMKDGGPGKPSKGPSASKSLIPKKPFKQPMTNAQTDANNAFTDRRERRQMRTAVGATVLGTAAALLNTPGGRKAMKKTKQAVVGGVKKGVTAIKNIRGTGEYISNPETGKMQRVPRAKKPAKAK